MQKQERITTEEIYGILLTLLKDEMMATYSVEEQGITMRFLNGQSFLLTLKEDVNV